MINLEAVAQSAVTRDKERMWVRERQRVWHTLTLWARLPCNTYPWHAIKQSKSQDPKEDGSFLHTAWLKSKISEAIVFASMLGSAHVTELFLILVFSAIMGLLSCSKSRSLYNLEGVEKVSPTIFFHDHLFHVSFALIKRGSVMVKLFQGKCKIKN